jgi:hypothetical protein
MGIIRNILNEAEDGSERDTTAERPGNVNAKS